MASLLINVTIAVGSVLAWLSIVRGRGTDDQLALGGLGSLKYYTVLSNLFSGLTSALYVLTSLMPHAAPTPLVLALKLTAAATVLVTFLTTLVLLTPVYGWGSMYQGGNFWLHLALPLLAAADIVLFVPIRTLLPWATLCPVAFTAAYAVGYLRRVLKYGAQKDGKTYDFYGFLRWGKEKIWLVATGMLFMTWLLALVLYLMA